MPLINCHAHTVNSDGCASVLEMATKAKELGHCALVITDHDSVNFPTHKIVEREVELLDEMGLLPLPVIVGSEIVTPFGEFLLFGHMALRNWMHEQGRLQIIARHYDLSAWVDMFRTYVTNKVSFTGGGRSSTKRYKLTPIPYAMIMCHPTCDPYVLEEYPKEWWDLVHGFEVQNGRMDLHALNVKAILQLRELIPGAMELRNSDAHTVDGLAECCNEIPHEITTEAALVKWLRSGRKNWRLQHTPDVAKVILEEHMRGIECTQKMMEGMKPCPPEYMDVINKNMKDLLG